jgi:hypothetical protein
VIERSPPRIANNQWQVHASCPGGLRQVSTAVRGCPRLEHAPFLELSPNPPDFYATADLVAVSLLGVRFSPPAVQTLLHDAHATATLAALPDKRPIWEATEADLERVVDAHQALRRLPGIGRVKATRLLARKRPHLIPTTEKLLVPPDSTFDEGLRVFRATLSDITVRERLDIIATTAAIAVPTLRVLDALSTGAVR